MRRHAKKAYDKLIKMGVHMAHPSWAKNGHFAISGESEHGDWSDLDNHPEKALIIDYYSEYGTEISKSIEDVLKDNDLYCEWVNPGVLAVHDA